jgi:UDP-N-acetylglucosamine transferase subunit ALG13
MIFLTVGTQFAFDRLVIAIDKAIAAGFITEQIFAQTGPTTYLPRNFESKPYLEKNVFDKILSQSSAIIAHAGMGSIMMAVEYNKPLLVMPRLKKYSEVINNHQLALAKRFELDGHLLVAYNELQLPEKIRQLKTFVPQKRHPNPKAITESISRFLTELNI